MQQSISSFRDFFARLISLYKIEIALLACAGALAVGAFSVFLFSSESSSSANIVIEEEPEKITEIYIAIEGAVTKPGVYTFSTQPRLQAVLDKAGGLSEEADRVYIARTFNMAALLADQQKIYVPTIEEVEAGILTGAQIQGSQTQVASGDTERIDINMASAIELDTLPGVGEITAQKIIDNRPYQLPTDLLERKIVNSSTFEKIKDLISVRQ